MEDEWSAERADRRGKGQTAGSRGGDAGAASGGASDEDDDLLVVKRRDVYNIQTADDEIQAAGAMPALTVGRRLPCTCICSVYCLLWAAFDSHEACNKPLTTPTGPFWSNMLALFLCRRCGAHGRAAGANKEEEAQDQAGRGINVARGV